MMQGMQFNRPPVVSVTPATPVSAPAEVRALAGTPAADQVTPRAPIAQAGFLAPPVVIPAPPVMTGAARPRASVQSPPPGPPPVAAAVTRVETWKLQDPAAVIEVPSGNDLALVLQANYTTPFRWYVVKVDDALGTITDVYKRQEGADPARMGVGGAVTFTCAREGRTAAAGQTYELVLGQRHIAATEPERTRTFRLAFI